MKAFHKVVPKICLKFSEALKLKPSLSAKPVLINIGALNDSIDQNFFKLKKN